MAFSLTLEIYRDDSLLSTLALESASVTHKAMGGAVSASFDLSRTYTDAFAAIQGDYVRLLASGQVHFTGFVSDASKTLRGGQQTIPATGWWTYLKTAFPFGATPSLDHENFGAGSDDHPFLATAFDIAEYLVDTYAVGGNLSAPASTFKEPSASTKVGVNGFVARQNADNVATLLEVLATMDDGWAGVTADGRIYYLNRADMIGETTRGSFSGSAQVELVRGAVNGLGFTLLDGELSAEAYPETRIVVYGRDKSEFTRASRAYSLDGTTQPNRTHHLNVPQITRGAGARRYARGRFARFGLTVAERAVNVSANIGTSAPFEPWRGRVVLLDTDGETILDQGVMGDCSIRYKGNVEATFNLGEQNAFDQSSRDPALNPDAPWFQRLDDPVVEIGDSGPIDFGDTFDGDGNDLHTNPAYVNQDDPGDGFYGTDLADPANVPGGGSGTGTLGPSRLLYNPDPPIRGLALFLSYAPNAGPLAEAEDVNLRWWKNAQTVDLGEVAMVFNDSVARWEVTVTVPLDAVQLNIQFNNDLADPLDLVDDNGGANWNLTTVANLTNDAAYSLPLHGHLGDLPADGGALFQNFAFPGTP